MTIISNSITLHRKAKDGIDGIDGINGQDALNVVLSADTVIIPTIDGDVSDSTIRSITATMYSGSTPLKPVSITSSVKDDDGFAIDIINANTLNVQPFNGSPMTNVVTKLTIVGSLDGVNYTIQKDLAVLGSAQGQSVAGPTGASVSRIAKTYKATADNIQPDADSTGWQLLPMEPTTELPYVWCREITYVTGGDYAETEYPISTTVSLLLKQGAQGYEGCIIRKSEWEPGKQYRNDSNLTPSQVAAEFGGDPTRYIDEVTVSQWNGGDGKHYQCKHTHISLAEDRDNTKETLTHVESGTLCWEAMQPLDPFHTPFADITRAFIQYLQAQQLVITDPSTGKPYGAFGGGLEYPLWFGGTSPDTAVTKISKDGHGYFDGIIRSRGVDMALTEAYYDEYYYPTHAQGFSLDLDPYDSGKNAVYLVDINGEPTISAYHGTLSGNKRRASDVERNINVNVKAWILLPYAHAAIEGRTLDIYVPNHLTCPAGNNRYYDSIGVTSSNGVFDEMTPKWIDTYVADLDSVQSSFCQQWTHYSYGAAIMSSRYYALTDDPASVSHLKVCCTKVRYGTRDIYKWLILESQNVRFSWTNNPNGLDDINQPGYTD